MLAHQPRRNDDGGHDKIEIDEHKQHHKRELPGFTMKIEMTLQFNGVKYILLRTTLARTAIETKKKL